MKLQETIKFAIGRARKLKGRAARDWLHYAIVCELSRSRGVVLREVQVSRAPDGMRVDIRAHPRWQPDIRAGMQALGLARDGEGWHLRQ